MSGGVDSSVAAALLAEQGHDVIGLSMQLYDQRGEETFGSCCTLDDLHDARRVATALGFPHYIVNFEQQFRETVIANFVQEYAAGRTPIPCAHCNSDLKFSTLLDRAQGLGATHVATGHYAQVTSDSDGRWQLRRGADPDKDQSYFLFSLTQEQLGGALFPVGALPKHEVREQARPLGLAVAEKPDSQEICFIPDGDYASFVARRDPSVTRGGVVVDESGRELGAHGGVHRFTVGQRKGLGVASPVPLYVLRIDASEQRVTVGPRSSLERTAFTHRRRQLDCGNGALRLGARIGADPPSPHRRARTRARAARSARRVRVRHAAAGDHAWPGGGVLRWRRGARRWVDRLTRSSGSGTRDSTQPDFTWAGLLDQP